MPPAVPPPAAAPFPPIPPTLLPSSSSAQTRYLHATQQAYLRQLYAHKVLLAAQQQGDDELPKHHSTSRRSRRGGGGHHDSITGGGAGSDNSDVDADQPWASFGGPSYRKRKAPADDDGERIDPAHVFELEYDLSPGGSSDAYYHGPYPPPPGKVVRAILKATRTPPFFDPEGLSVRQLESVTRGFWASEGGEVVGDLGDREAGAEDEWEQDVIAQFSTGCAGRIAKSVAGMLPSQRPMHHPPAPPLPPPPPPPQAGPPGGLLGGQQGQQGMGGSGGIGGLGQQSAMGRQQSPFVEQQEQPRYNPQPYWPQKSMFGGERW